jgi:hypothetical protein
MPTKNFVATELISCHLFVKLTAKGLGREAMRILATCLPTSSLTSLNLAREKLSLSLFESSTI